MAPWQEIKRKNFTQWKTLAHFLEWDEALQSEILQNSPFPLNLPLRLAEKIDKNTLDDPILRQFLPLSLESAFSENFSYDPLKEQKVRKGGKLLHKYFGRALLLATGVCAMNCRFCFRRHFDYETNEKGFDTELDYLAANSDLSEVILSGGDPLSLSNAILKTLFEKIAQIPHIKRIRFHTRFPIGIPERIDDEFLSLIETSPKQIYFVLHCNVAKELDDDIFVALKKIQKLGVPLLNHTVLLKGVNDTANALGALSHALIDQGIIPYYLNHLDKVQGAAHFDVSEATGLEIIDALRQQLPGYGVPRYVKEVPGTCSKTPIEKSHFFKDVKTEQVKACF